MPLLTPEDETFLQENFKQHLDKDVTIVLFTLREASIVIPGFEREARYCAEANEIIEAVAGLSDKIHLEVYDYRQDTDKMKEYDVDRVPAAVLSVDGVASARFVGVPSGFEFSTLVQDIIDLSTGELHLSTDTIEFLQGLEQDLHLRVFVTPSCTYCPQAARLAHQMAAANPARVKAEVIEATEFPDLAQQFQIRAVPKTVINDKVSFDGALPEMMVMPQIYRALGILHPEE